MTKAVFKYDLKTKEFAGSLVVDDDYEVADGQTEAEPEQGLYEPITWDGTKWVGTDQAVWQAEQDAQTAAYLKEHPELEPKQSVTDKVISELTLQIAQNKANQDMVNAQLLLAAAQQTEKETN